MVPTRGIAGDTQGEDGGTAHPDLFAVRRFREPEQLGTDDRETVIRVPDARIMKNKIRGISPSDQLESRSKTGRLDKEGRLRKTSSTAPDFSLTCQASHHQPELPVMRSQTGVLERAEIFVNNWCQTPSARCHSCEV